MQHSTTRQAKQKICAYLDHHWSIKCSFLCVQTNWVCPSGTQRYCKNDSDSSLESLTVTRVESFCEKRDSSRVTIFLNVTWVDSESPQIMTRVELLTRVTLSLAACDQAGIKINSEKIEVLCHIRRPRQCFLEVTETCVFVKMSYKHGRNFVVKCGGATWCETNIVIGSIQKWRFIYTDSQSYF